MSDSANLNQALETLLASNASPEEFTRRLFELNLAQARAADPELAELLRVCAIPRSFDAATIGALRGAPDDTATNERLLAGVAAFTFVQALEDGEYAYHDNTRDMLLTEWQSDQHRTQFEHYTQRLADFYEQRGREHHDQEQYESALEHLNRAVELRPATAEIQALRGKIYCRLGQYAEALDDLNQAIALLDEDGELFFWRSIVHHHTKDYVAKLSDLLRAIELQPEKSDNYIGRGMMYFEMQDYAAAIADFTRAIELQPERGINNRYRLRGLTYYHMQDYASALADFTRVIELQMENGDNYGWRGVVYLNLGDNPAALQDLDRAVELKSDESHIRFWRGMVRSLLGQDEGATGDWQQAATLAQTETDACRQQRVLAKLALLDGRGATARDHYEQALGGVCQSIVLRTERGHLQLLARLFPARDDIGEVAAWFSMMTG